MKFLFLCVTTLAAVTLVRAQPLTTFQKARCTLRARACIDPAYGPKESSRFDLILTPPPDDPAQWEFTLPANENYPFALGISGETAPAPYGDKKRTTIRATLHRFLTLDERVTFQNLPLNPPPTHGAATRVLDLKEARTQSTPSGISVTLPAQSGGTFPFSISGNAKAVFIGIRISPATLLSRLPASPLFQKLGKNARIKLEIAPPNDLVSYAADNTYSQIAVGIPHLKSATTMNLTLIVRQKVEVQTVPVALEVPVQRPQNTK